MSSHSKLYVAAMMSWTLAACSSNNKDSDKIYEAQACLDTATKDTAASCLTNIEGLETKQAYLLRCAGMFIQDGFDDPARFANAFDQLKNKDSTTNPTLGLLGYMAFSASSTASENQARANQALEYCQKSESAGYIMLASMANIATTITAVANTVTIDPDNPPTAEEMAGAIALIISNPIAQASIGATAITAYESNCSGTSAVGNADLCADLSSAINQAGNPTDPASVGAALLTVYQSLPK